MQHKLLLLKLLREASKRFHIFYSWLEAEICLNHLLNKLQCIANTYTCTSISPAIDTGTDLDSFPQRVDVTAQLSRLALGGGSCRSRCTQLDNLRLGGGQRVRHRLQLLLKLPVGR